MSQEKPKEIFKAFLSGLFSIKQREVPYYGDTILDENGCHCEQIGVC